MTQRRTPATGQNEELSSWEILSLTGKRKMDKGVGSQESLADGRQQARQDG